MNSLPIPIRRVNAGLLPEDALKSCPCGRGDRMSCPQHGGFINPAAQDAIERIDAWLDRDVDGVYRVQDLAQDWARVAKCAEEAGEAVAALIAVTGQNPRKGVCGTLDELLDELADTACTGMLAIQHFTKDRKRTADIVETAMRKALNRALAAEEPP